MGTIRQLLTTFSIGILCACSAIVVAQDTSLAEVTTIKDGKIYWEVQEGDSLWSIAKAMKSSPDQLARLNEQDTVDGWAIFPGTVLIVAEGDQSTVATIEQGRFVAVEPGDTVQSIARDARISLEQLLNLNSSLDPDKPLQIGQPVLVGFRDDEPEPTAEPESTPETETEIVFIYEQIQVGDSLSVIAQRVDLPVAELIELNQLEPTDILIPGEELIIGSYQPDSFDDLILGESDEELAVVTPTVPPSPTPIPTETPIPTVTPLPIPTSPAGMGQICLYSFQDFNRNGVRDEDEPLLAHVQFTIAAGFIETVVEATQANPVICTAVQPNTYRITRIQANSEFLTTNNPQLVELNVDDELSIGFGVIPAPPTAVPTQVYVVIGQGIELSAPKVDMAEEPQIESAQTARVGWWVALLPVGILLGWLFGRSGKKDASASKS